jgi:hypothetical protein
MKATVVGCEAAANPHVATTEMPACESAATAKSTATEVTATAKASGVASTKATPVASAAATTTTTMATATATSTSSGEGVSLDCGHAHGDDRENDCYFAQHQTLLLRTHLRPWIFSHTPRQLARSGRVTNGCRERALACL